jgi:hypothetical protein
MSTPRLSLCLIAKDEAAFLPGLLRSVQGWVDELILCDTGSADATVAIAEAAGAVIVHHPWAGDFAAARNASFGPATGDWILVLDADERLAQGAGPALRAALLQPIDCGLLPLHHAARLDAPEDAVRSGAARLGEVARLPRLFRRSPDLRMRGRVHESVSDWLVGKRVAHVEAPLIHLGRVPEIVAARDKGARNLALLQLRVAEEPEDPAVYAHLASELFTAGRGAEAVAVALAGWEALKAAFGPRQRAGLPPQVVPLATLVVQILLQRGALPEAEAALAFARRHSLSPHPNLDHLEGELARAQGEPARARAAYQRALAADGQAQATELLPGVTGLLALTGLASAALALGAPAEALEAATAPQRGPRPPLALRLAEIEALARLGQVGRARALLAPFVAAEARGAVLGDVAYLDRLLGGERPPLGPAVAWADPLRRRRA